MIASLGMYDPPWLHAANDRLWQAIATAIADAIPGAPATLTRDRPLPAIWTAPDLLLAQTCGYPLTMELRDRVRLVATPLYDAPGCEGAWHRSAIVVRADDPARTLAACRGYRVAVNAPDSNTGMNLLRAAVAPLAREGRFFGAVLPSGAHAHSAEMVRSGAADIAAIDAVTLALLADHDPALMGDLHVLDWTAATPGLPLITAAGTPDALLAALRAALGAMPPIRALRLQGFTVLERDAYAVIPALAHAAAQAGFPELA